MIGKPYGKAKVEALFTYRLCYNIHNNDSTAWRCLMLDTHQLNVFLVAADTLNFTQAARLLHMSQPSVSQHIQSLEHTLGQELFVRAGRHIELTDAGPDAGPPRPRDGRAFRHDRGNDEVAARRGVRPPARGLFHNAGQVHPAPAPGHLPPTLSDGAHVVPGNVTAQRD